MTGPIVVRGHRKSVLRKRFREIQRERGAGAIVAFANGRAAHVQECLRGLLSTRSITEPVYSVEGFAVVKILDQLDEGTPIDLGENAPVEQPTVSNPAPVDVYQENAAGDVVVDTSMDGTVPEDHVDAGTDAPKLPEIPDEIKDVEPPPTSGPGSGADAWRAYAAKATSSPYESWAALNRAEIIELLKSEGVLE